jgi:hypothetical protein
MAEEYLNLCARAFVEVLSAWAEDLGAADPSAVALEVFYRYRHLPVTVDNNRSLISDLRTRARAGL